MSEIKEPIISVVRIIYAFLVSLWKNDVEAAIDLTNIPFHTGETLLTKREELQRWYSNLFENIELTQIPRLDKNLKELKTISVLKKMRQDPRINTILSRININDNDYALEILVSHQQGTSYRALLFIHKVDYKFKLVAFLPL